MPNGPLEAGHLLNIQEEPELNSQQHAWKKRVTKAAYMNIHSILGQWDATPWSYSVTSTCMCTQKNFLRIFNLNKFHYTLIPKSSNRDKTRSQNPPDQHLLYIFLPSPFWKFPTLSYTLGFELWSEPIDIYKDQDLSPNKEAEAITTYSPEESVSRWQRYHSGCPDPQGRSFASHGRNKFLRETKEKQPSNYKALHIFNPELIH